jgi:anti-sigma B factor antagonist
MAELTPAPPELTVTPSSEGGVPVLAVVGELDMSNAAALKTAIASSGGEQSGRLVFDLSGLRFIDSAGIAVLLEAAERVDSVSVRDPAPAVRRVIEVTGLTDVLPLEPRT